MNLITLSSQQKSERGLMLSAMDIQALLKDPNSWVSKLYHNCLLAAAITEEFFIHLIHIIQKEQQLVKQQLIGWTIRNEIQQQRQALYWQDCDADIHTNKENTDLSASLCSLQMNMEDLLTFSQENMSINQLTFYHQLVTTNFNNQISATLGAFITLSPTEHDGPLKLAVPQMPSRPIATVSQLLKHSPTLRQQLELDEPASHYFAHHITIGSLGYLATINKWREILEHNRSLLQERDIDIDTITLTPKLLNDIDIAVQSCLDNNDGLLNALLKNNTLTLNAMRQERDKENALDLRTTAALAR